MNRDNYENSGQKDAVNRDRIPSKLKSVNFLTENNDIVELLARKIVYPVRYNRTLFVGKDLVATLKQNVLCFRSVRPVIQCGRYSRRHRARDLVDSLRRDPEDAAHQ